MASLDSVCIMQVKFVGVNNFHFIAMFLKGQGSLNCLEMTNASLSSYQTAVGLIL